MLENVSNMELSTNLIILFRIILASTLAFIPGMERELTGKFAGLRTHILVCTGSCVFTILSIYGFNMTDGAIVATQNDPARISAQVITGIGFIGAGTVMRHGANVSGITTAATLWVCAAIGMSCGCGEYFTAIIAAITTLIVLIFIRRIEKSFISKRKITYILYEISISSPMDTCGSAPTDILTALVPILSFTTAMSLTSDKKKRKSLLINLGIPLMPVFLMPIIGLKFPILNGIKGLTACFAAGQFAKTLALKVNKKICGENESQITE